MPSFHPGFWDIVLVVMVIAQATAVAYIYDPRLKALMLVTPIPFTFSSLALGKPINATNAVGLLFLTLFWHTVRWLHYAARVPIIISILASFIGFCACGAVISPHVPQTPAAFWIMCGAGMAVSLVMHLRTKHRAEEGHRSPLPLPLKLLAVSAVILVLDYIKMQLQGFMTVAPMVGFVTAYETRRSLWTTCRYIPIFNLALIPMMIVVYLFSPRWGLGPALALGWVVYMAVIVPIVRQTWAEDARRQTR